MESLFKVEKKRVEVSDSLTVEVTRHSGTMYSWEVFGFTVVLLMMTTELSEPRHRIPSIKFDTRLELPEIIYWDLAMFNREMQLHERDWVIKEATKDMIAALVDGDI